MRHVASTFKTVLFHEGSEVFPHRDVWQYLKTFSIVITWGRRRGGAPGIQWVTDRNVAEHHTYNVQDSPQQRVLWSEMSNGAEVEKGCFKESRAPGAAGVGWIDLAGEERRVQALEPEP